jgi:trehalose 6-phosphate phosphatase
MPPNALDRIDMLNAARSAAGSLLLGLDFDGTLAPIVSRPELAAVLPAARAALDRIVHRGDTPIALVSGRGLADLRSRIDLDGIYYAGNHGLEIEGPGVHRIHEEADGARQALQRLAGELESALADIDGVLVEDKSLTLSVHFRLVDDPAVERHVRDTVRECARDHADIRLTDGKKVVEIRPDVDWHKGRAFRFLRDVIERRSGRAPAVFIGDDRTDEDAFRVLGNTDCSIVVGDPPQHESSAHACLRSPDEVALFLERLA